MAAANTHPFLRESELKHCLPQIYKALLTASLMARPGDPVQFLKNTLVVYQGHESIEAVDWYKFVAFLEQCTALAHRSKITVDADQERIMCLLQKAYSWYRNHLISSCFRKWKEFTLQAKESAMELPQKMEQAKTYYERKCQQDAFTKWVNWVKARKKKQAVAVEILERIVNTGRLKRSFAAWCVFTKDSKKIKELIKRLDAGGCNKISKKEEGGFDVFSGFSNNILLKVFRHLKVRDLLNCAEVCCKWKSLIQSGSLWSQINFSLEKDWINDKTVKQILENYRPFVTRLNLRGCASLEWPSLCCICECRNLQELNMSECVNVTDTLMEKVVNGCPCLLYLNLSCTLITNTTLKELFRHCLNLQYLSLAHCYRFTDEGFLYLSRGKGCYNLLHLDLSGCMQLTVNGFEYISAGCPSLREIVINDMPTLSDRCVLALIEGCRSLAAISLLNTPYLSDVTLTAIAQTVRLNAFSTKGNNQLTDIGWTALCNSSQSLHWLHAAECPRMTNASLKSIATLQNLRHLNISFCNNVTDIGIQYLTEGFSTELRELNVSHCSLITDVSVMRIAQRMCNLHHLNLSYCERLTDVSLECLCGSSISSLDISGCNTGNQGLAALEGVHLKKLVVAKCADITDTGIEKLCKNVTDLEDIDVSHCVALSDRAIRAISFYCRGLVTLRMPGCPKVTDKAVHCLTNGSRHLRELDVSDCVLLTDRTVEHLKKICPPLCSVRMASCRNISKVAALKLQPHVEYWEHNND